MFNVSILQLVLICTKLTPVYVTKRHRWTDTDTSTSLFTLIKLCYQYLALLWSPAQVSVWLGEGGEGMSASMILPRTCHIQNGGSSRSSIRTSVVKFASLT